jgi:hypothetical protein
LLLPGGGVFVASFVALPEPEEFRAFGRDFVDFDFVAGFFDFEAALAMVGNHST